MPASDCTADEPAKAGVWRTAVSSFPVPTGWAAGFGRSATPTEGDRTVSTELCVWGDQGQDFHAVN